MTDQAVCSTEKSRQNGDQCVSENSQLSVQPEERLPVFRPRVDLVDSGEFITLWADLPGADENSVEIMVENETLTLKAALQPPVFEGKKRLLQEYQEGHYERVFSISDEIDRENIEAVVHQGVLKLVLPKTQKALSHKVTVKAG